LIGEHAQLSKGKDQAKRLAEKIKLIVLDVDGVLTDNCIYINDQGIESKKFNILDGMGIWMAFKAGMQVALISGRKSRATEYRARQLGIKHVYLGRIDKIQAYRKLKRTAKVNDQQVAFMGDDILDISMLKSVGLPTCPGNADSRVKKYAKLVTGAKGGEGAVRELVEFILKAKKKSPLEWVP
jgi:3-deoxy-D-manno-octulosonate 8-phosphate phosphatase (KDO 8-P phosphatase)